MGLPTPAEGRNLPPKFAAFEMLEHGDPYVTYAQMRESGPLLRAAPGIWILTRYQEVSAALRDVRLGGFRFDQNAYLIERTVDREMPDESAARSFLDGVLVAANGPDHLRLRRMVAQPLITRLTPELQHRIDVSAEKALSIALERGGLEVVSELSHVLPVTIMTTVLGIPATELNSVQSNVLKLSSLFSPVLSAEARVAANQAVTQLRGLVAEVFDKRLRIPKDDLISDIAGAAKQGLLGRAAAIDNIIFLLFAGLETSVTMIAAGCAALATHPAEFEKLRMNPANVGPAVEEFLRYDAPTQITARIVLHPLEISGRSLRPGRILLLFLGSANHDEKQFRRPSMLDIGRSPNPHLAFGAGPHYCIGATLARMEGAAVFRQLSRMFSKFEATVEPVREPCATPRIYSRVEVRVSAP